MYIAIDLLIKMDPESRYCRDSIPTLSCVITMASHSNWPDLISTV